MADLVVVMNHGAIEQVGTPQDVYTRPASRFVADFVGTTSAFSGVLAAPDRVRAGPLELACARHDALAVGSAVAVRIRPEAMGLAPAPGPGIVSGRLVQRAFHGAMLRLTIDAGLPRGAPLILELSTHAPGLDALAPDATVHVAIPASAVMLFADA